MSFRGSPFAEERSRGLRSGRLRWRPRESWCRPAGRRRLRGLAWPVCRFLSLVFVDRWWFRRDVPALWSSLVGHEARWQREAAKKGTVCGLLTQPEPADDFQISRAVGVAKIRQQSGSLTDHFQEPAPTGVVFLVHTKVLV